MPLFPVSKWRQGTQESATDNDNLPPDFDVPVQARFQPIEPTEIVEERHMSTPFLQERSEGKSDNYGLLSTIQEALTPVPRKIRQGSDFLNTRGPGYFQ